MMKMQKQEKRDRRDIQYGKDINYSHISLEI